MKQRKRRQKISQKMFLLLSIIGFLTGSILLQKTVEQRGKSKAEENKIPSTEKKEESSQEKIFENEEYSVYTDRIVKRDQIPSGNVAYALQSMQAILEKETILEAGYLVPIPQRAVLETAFGTDLKEGYLDRKQQYEEFVENLTNQAPKQISIINPLPELEKHANEEIYFRTEHAWTMLGAFYGIQEIRKAIGESPASLQEYHRYRFGDFSGDLKMLFLLDEKQNGIKNKIQTIPGDSLFLYLHPENPNQETVMMQNVSGEKKTVKRRTIQMNGRGSGAILGDRYFHAIVEGNGTGGILLLADAAGKFLAPYLADLYEKVYVVNVETDREFIHNISTICHEYSIRNVMWAQKDFCLGKRSFVAALHPFLEETENGTETVKGGTK